MTRKPGINKAPMAAAKRIAGLIAVLAIIWFFLNQGQGTISIASAKSITLSPNQTVFVRIFNGSVSAIKLVVSSPTSASFYVSKVPVLYGPVISFTMGTLTGLNVSSDGSNMADMNIFLGSSSNKSVTIQVSPLLSTLGVRPSPLIKRLSPASLGGGLTTIVTLSTSTVASTSTSTAESTTMAQNATAALFQQSMTLINQTSIGALMKKYNLLYEKDTACNQSIYNASYLASYGSPPPAPVSFENVSSQTPTSIAISETKLAAANNVRIVYSTVSPSALTSGPAVIAMVNTSAQAYLRNVTYTGLYSGFSYTILNDSYTFQSRINNNCGAYISPH